jgi:hypothetical protein
MWDSPRVSAFCPVRKLKVYGHFILLIRPLPTAAAAAAIVDVYLYMLENFYDPEYY